MSEREFFAAIVEFSGVNPVHRDTRILRREGRNVTGKQEKCAWRKAGSIGERKSDSVSELQTAQIERIRAGVFQFQKFEFIAVRRSKIRRVIHNFADV